MDGEPAMRPSGKLLAALYPFGAGAIGASEAEDAQVYLIRKV